MPGRNIVKEYSPNSYYHVYSRGINKDIIFRDNSDFEVFISLFKRYLSDKPTLSSARIPYPNYQKRLKLISYCLMPNHIHLLIYQEDESALTNFMRSIMTSYSMYFNKKYKHLGPVFQSRYRAVKIDDQSYFEHISRYIHLNPRNWDGYPYSSLVHYRSSRLPEWLDPEVVLSQFKGIAEYLTFLNDYVETKQELEDLKWQLANDTED